MLFCASLQWVTSSGSVQGSSLHLSTVQPLIGSTAGPMKLLCL